MESAATREASYNHRYKHGAEGKRVLREGLISRRERMGGINNAGPEKRGGNGAGLTVPQAFLLRRLGDGWRAEHVVSTGKRISGGLPTCYKIDIAHPGCKIAIEVDGASHNAARRRRADARKDSWLIEQGWTVLRVTNREAVIGAARIVDSLPAECPVEAEVMGVIPYTVNDLFLFEVELSEAAGFYAHGILVGSAFTKC